MFELLNNIIICNYNHILLLHFKLKHERENCFFEKASHTFDHRDINFQTICKQETETMNFSFRLDSENLSLPLLEKLI